MSSPEQLRSTESNVETQQFAGKRSEQLKNRQEKVGELSPEAKAGEIEAARLKTKEIFAQEAGKERKGADTTSEGGVRRVTKAERKASYKKTMSIIQSEMKAPSRAFSKAIHSPFVEKSSEVIGSSLARPNAVLAGSFTAFVLVTGIYVIARTFGYQLSGFETIGAFVLGWVLGILFDYVKVMATGKR